MIKRIEIMARRRQRCFGIFGSGLVAVGLAHSFVVSAGPLPSPELGLSKNHLIERVGIIGEKDDREVLSKTAKSLGFTKREIDQAMACTGKVLCLGEEPSQFSAGAICAPGSRDHKGNCPADRIATALHGFSWENQRLRKGINTCKFTNYIGQTVSLNLEDINNTIQYNTNRYGSVWHNRRSDKVAIRLNSPIKQCNPYTITNSANAPKSDETVTVISYPPPVLVDRGFNGREPLAYQCMIKKVLPEKYGLSGGYVTDCDVDPGQSGGFVILREPGKGLSVSAIITNTGHSPKNYAPYSDTTYTLAVGLHADFIPMARFPGATANWERSVIVANSIGPLYCDDSLVSSGSAILLSTGNIAVMSQHLRDGTASRQKCEATFAGLPATSFKVPQTAEVAADDRIIMMPSPTAAPPSNGLALYKGDPVAARLVAATEGHPITERACTAWQVPTTPSQADVEACKPEGNESLLLADTKDGYQLIAIAGSKGQWIKVQ